MKRSPMRRSPFKRRPSRQREKLVRPGTTPPMPPGWAKLSRWIKARDEATCRRCGGPAERGACEHIIPRRLLVGREVSFRQNLAWLCLHCHGVVTHDKVEPDLYRADLQAFARFLAVLDLSGPIPSSALLARAYARLRRLSYGQAHQESNEGRTSG